MRALGVEPSRQSYKPRSGARPDTRLAHRYADLFGVEGHARLEAVAWHRVDCLQGHIAKVLVSTDLRHAHFNQHPVTDSNLCVVDIVHLFWCRERGSNPHASRQLILSQPCMPIPNHPDAVPSQRIELCKRGL